MLCAAHAAEDGKNASACAHVDHVSSIYVVCKDELHHQSGGGMVACAECHARVYHDIVLGLRYIGVEAAVYHYLATYDNRLEIMTLPLGVPVLSRHIFGIERDLAIERQLGDSGFYGSVVIQFRGHVGSHCRTGK